MQSFHEQECLLTSFVLEGTYVVVKGQLLIFIDYQVETLYLKHQAVINSRNCAFNRDRLGGVDSPQV